MAENKPHPDLEACVGKEVSVTYRTPEREVTLTGEMRYLAFPWFIQVVADKYPSGQIREGTRSVNFLGPTDGIVRVEREGKEVYVQEGLPKPYTQRSLAFDSDVEEINQLRRRLFGEGFDY
jgi:hypothetical protein